tara:strand:+ start:157 stop:684 length:528 start_codon:yes stop_codon:yes gene_type:complete
MEYTNYNDEMRNQYVTLLNKELKNEKISRQIEKSIYNYTIELAIKKNYHKTWSDPYFKKLYVSKIRSIYSNVKEDSYIKNENFKNKILSNEIDPKNIASLSVFDIYPEIWKSLLDDKSKKDKLKFEYKPEAMTDIFKCRKCGSRSCSYYELQTRSADEPMTQFINCLDCNNSWKQ